MADVISATAKEAVLIANTPPFLLRKLRTDSSVRAVADTYSIDEILARLNALFLVAPSNPVELAERYVWMIAFGINASFAQWRTANIQPRNIPWGFELKALIEEEKRETFAVSKASNVGSLTSKRETAMLSGWSRQSPLDDLTSAGKR